MRRTRDLVLLGVLGALLVVTTIIVTVVAPNTQSPTGESQFGWAFFLFLFAGLTLHRALVSGSMDPPDPVTGRRSGDAALSTGCGSARPPSSARHANEAEDLVGARGVVRFEQAADR